MRLQRWMMLLMLWALVPAMASYAQNASGGVPAKGTRLEAIDDPTLGMTAYSVTVPANWHFAGTIIQGTSCSGIAFPVFRATSRDGLTVMETLPRMDWGGRQVRAPSLPVTPTTIACRSRSTCMCKIFSR